MSVGNERVRVGGGLLVAERGGPACGMGVCGGRWRGGGIVVSIDGSDLGGFGVAVGALGRDRGHGRVEACSARWEAGGVENVALAPFDGAREAGEGTRKGGKDEESGGSSEEEV